MMGWRWSCLAAMGVVIRASEAAEEAEEGETDEAASPAEVEAAEEEEQKISISSIHQANMHR